MRREGRGTGGWPRTIKEVKDIPVRTARDMRSGVVSIPAGTQGTVSGSARWNQLAFQAEACIRCQCAPRIIGCSPSDFEIA